MKRYFKLGIVVLMAILLMAPNVKVTDAASKQLKMKKGTLWLGDESWSCCDFSKTNDKVKVLKIKSSKTKVIKVKKTGSKWYDHYLVPKKTGKSKITIKYKYKKKTYTTSATYTVKKYPAPIQDLNVNGETVNTSSHKYSIDYDDYKGTFVSINLTPKSGWTIDWAYYNTYNNVTEEDNFVDVEGTGKIEFNLSTDEEAYVFYYLKNKKKEFMQYSIRFYRE